MASPIRHFLKFLFTNKGPIFLYFQNIMQLGGAKSLPQREVVAVRRTGTGPAEQLEGHLSFIAQEMCLR